MARLWRWWGARADACLFADVVCKAHTRGALDAGWSVRSGGVPMGIPAAPGVSDGMPENRLADLQSRGKQDRTE